MHPTAWLVVATGGFGVLLGACGATSTAAPAAGSAAVSGHVTVFAAASLTGAYTDIGTAFEKVHPGTKVMFNFAASNDLVTQIQQGADADVFASADEANMKRVTDAGDSAGKPEVFASNALQIIVERGNPKGVTGLADLAKPGIVYVTCDTRVPIGKYAAQALSAAGVAVKPASLEENVKGIVTKVVLGEADAGIVYRTDVAAAHEKAQGVDIPVNVNVRATYPVAVLEHAPNAAAAAAFVDFVLGAAGQRILSSYGFGPP